MGISTLCSDLIEDVRLRADLPAFTTSTSIRTADVLYWLRTSLQRLSGIIGQTPDASHFVQETTVTTTADIDVVSLPQNAQTLVSIYYVKDGTTELPLDRMGPDDLGDVESRPWSSETPRYALKGESIQLRPVPDAAYTLRVEYSTGMLITASTDYVPLYFGWSDWVVLDVVCKIKQRLQQPYSEFAQERAQVEQELRSQARRDRFKGSVVRDLRPRALETRRPWWPRG